MARNPRVLFVHDNFPAQFGRLGQWLAGLGWDITFATAATQAAADGIRIFTYAPHREPAKETHPYAQTMEKSVINAQGFVRSALAQRQEGYRPDLVVAHTGWGAGMFARQVFPEARFIPYCEWWYRYPGSDVVYLSELNGESRPSNIEGAIVEHARNAPIAMDLSQASAAICPTAFQASQFPAIYRNALSVMHDGIDTAYLCPDPAERRSTLGGLVAEDARVVTYATRGMEPHRCFPQFVASLPKVFEAEPRAVAVIAGENRVAYGSSKHRKTDWKEKALEDAGVDRSRVIFTGRLPYGEYRRLLRRSDAHVYLTVPFVLSWSMLESMSVGCAMVVSDTAPVTEYASEETARLVDLRKPGMLSERLIETLRDVAGSASRRMAAREKIRAELDMPDLYRRKAELFARVIKNGGS